MSVATRAAATAAGLLGSRVVPDLADRFHPVARFGGLMTALERRVWRDHRAAGAAYAVSGVVVAGLAARVARSTAAMTTVCAAGGQLRDTATVIGDHLERGDLVAARAALPALVGRDVRDLDESGIAAAVIESVAENMVDAVFAPAFWATVAGARGVAVHRALNTMDAMVGRRDERYAQFGWAAARADDVANWVPARLFAGAVAVVRPARATAILRTVASDAGAHPSPNAGVAESAMAAALGVELGGPLHYDDRFENRPRLGNGPRPGVADLRAAVIVADRAELALVATLLAGSLPFLRRTLAHTVWGT